MNSIKRQPRNLVAVRIALQDFEREYTRNLQSVIHRSDIKAISANQLMNAVKNAYHQFKSRHFAVDGQIELYQYPLMSMTASGKFRDQDLGMIVYVQSTCRCRAYQRKWVLPHDPQTEKQMNCREQMRVVNQSWKNESEQTRAAWNSAAEKYPAMTGRNLYTREWFQYVQSQGVFPESGFTPKEK